MASDTLPKIDKGGKVREKIVLQPGFHLVDWMKLMSVSTGVRGNKKISLKELAEHNTDLDCWTAYNGKVYNISQYLPYHPGGIAKLKLGAGKDCTELFNKYHRWVNIESILSKYMVGTLSDDIPDIQENLKEEEMSIDADGSSSKENITKVEALTELSKDES